MHGECQKGAWLNLQKRRLRFKWSGPSGGCLPYLAPQKRWRQRCRLVTYHTEINMQRCQEVVGRCLTSPEPKKQAYAVFAALTVKPRRNITRLHTCTIFVNTTRQFDWKRTISCISTDTFYTIKSFQASCFFSLHLIRFFFPFRIRHNEIHSIQGNVWKREMQF